MIVLFKFIYFNFFNIIYPKYPNYLVIGYNIVLLTIMWSAFYFEHYNSVT